jgi:hypothetical protein
MIRANTAAPERRPRNGHHADCPYPATDAQWCTICASIRKGRADRRDPEQEMTTP